MDANQTATLFTVVYIPDKIVASLLIVFVSHGTTEGRAFKRPMNAKEWQQSQTPVRTYHVNEERDNTVQGSHIPYHGCTKVLHIGLLRTTLKNTFEGLV